MGGEELKWRKLKHNQIMSPQGHLVHTVQLNPTMKPQISGRMASIGLSDVVTSSVNSEKTRMVIMIIIIIIIMNKSQDAQ